MLKILYLWEGNKNGIEQDWVKWKDMMFPVGFFTVIGSRYMYELLADTLQQSLRQPFFIHGCNVIEL